MDYKKLVMDYQKTALDSLIGFIAVDSVYNEATVSLKDPYGKGVSAALKYIEKLALKDGFNVKNIANRVVEISFGDITQNNIGIFAHADVVPATGNWNTPPFKATIKDGIMYGRGTSDDKGPAIAAYYALKALRDANLIKDYSVRLVIGGDEERGSSCMRYYFNEYRAPAPKYGFTPDAEFPLIYGEKAITNYVSKKVVDLYPLLKLSGGEAANSVIDRVNVTLSNDPKFLDYLQQQKVEYQLLTKDDQIVNIVVFGRSAHGSLPHLGENAAMIILKHLGKFYNHAFLNKISHAYADVNGRNFQGYFETVLLGESTYNIGLISYDGYALTFTTNFRYPETVDLDHHLLKVAIRTEMDIKIISTSKSLLFDPESDFIKTLLQAYVDETGDEHAVPLAIGGGTYAKECPNTVAFGSAFTGRPGDIHSPNEYVHLTDLYAQMAIYARAIYYLGTKL